jgi:hypothetical protein
MKEQIKEILKHNFIEETECIDSISEEIAELFDEFLTWVRKQTGSMTYLDNKQLYRVWSENVKDYKAITYEDLKSVITSVDLREIDEAREERK